ncbi:protein PIGBOS1 [Silurus meridionalis]|uniref:protein PIGBOS1 n=1 Tax=Silurus meridionalis TaxID=175797 RepID=UPI001EEB8B25|nr:protein PIGBOS1 [Silurus meridionalis]XP_046721119.1 protein PIGBOS1 [Silurus meridionalis]XP_046721120.1 protein PIGBOS1 [Silurus meridionalis]XP_046721121.1 protein PIGBOS1 [Silurus meridionalis]
MFPRRIPFNQIAFATLVGVGGGIYIYRPMFESPRRNQEAGSKAETRNEGQNNVGEEANEEREKKEPPSSSSS